MNIQLSDHFTYKKLLRFTFPSIIMLIFTSIYGVVDGIFISNFAGKTAFAAINLTIPYTMMFGCLGIMVGTGGTALISMTLGTGDQTRANNIFSQLVFGTIIGGIFCTILSLVLLRPAVILMGAEGEMIDLCMQYGYYILPATTAFLLQNEFQSFCAAAERPGLGLGLTVAAGITNMILDALFVGLFHWGLAGAAAATAISQCVGGLIPFFYFLRPNDTPLRLVRPTWEARVFLHTCANGSSELMTNISLSIVSILYNLQLLKLAGENGVAAYGVIMYVTFIFVSVFLGYGIGVAPVIGFHYGAGNHSELKNLLKKSMTLVTVFSLLLTLISCALSGPLSTIFVSYDPVLYDMTRRGLFIYSLSFVFSGFNIFSSSFFTALNNGLVSATISFLRTLLFQTLCVMILPMFWGLDGIWSAIVAAELLALLVSTVLLIKFKGRYHYA